MNVFLFMLLVLLFVSPTALAQSPRALDLNTDLLERMRETSDWTLAGKVYSDVMHSPTLMYREGQGVIVSTSKKSSEVHFDVEYQDMHLEMEFMLGGDGLVHVLFQGGYGIVLRDPDSENLKEEPVCGAIEPQNAQSGQSIVLPAMTTQPCRAAGLWQQFKATFEGPEFDAQGQLVAKARLRDIEINGVSVREYIELEETIDNASTEAFVIRKVIGHAAFRDFSYTTELRENEWRLEDRTPTTPVQLAAIDRFVVSRHFMLAPGTDGEESIVTHPVAVGNPHGTHYAIDSSTGALIHAWNGEFLDVTSGFAGRGGRPVRPMGSGISFKAKPVLLAVGSKGDLWPASYEGTGMMLRFLGYDRDNQGQPVFRYSFEDMEVVDEIHPGDRNLTRRISFNGEMKENLHVLVDQSVAIEPLEDKQYAMGDRKYYLKILEGPDAHILTGNHLAIPLKSLQDGALTYELSW